MTNVKVAEQLVRVEIVLVRRVRAVFVARNQAAFELNEKTGSVIQMQVGVKHIALQQVAVVLRGLPEKQGD